MTKVNCARDLRKFWQERDKAREKLDKKLANLPYSQKLVILGKMQANRIAMQNAEQVTKSSPKLSKT